MALIPSKVLYKWTPRDGQDAQQGKPVTPYTLDPSIVAGSKTMQGGAMVTVPIGLGKAMLTVKRFELPATFDWEDVPPAAQDAKTLAALCKKLKATGSPRYPDVYYDIDKMSIPERNRVAMLLFDYWGNTEYRFAMITSGSFSWDMVNPKPTNDILAALETRATSTWATEPPGVVRRIQRIPVLLPVKTVVTVKPGAEAQKVVPPDPVLSVMDADIAEIKRLTKRIVDLLEKSAAQMKERVEVANAGTALRTLLEQCNVASQTAGHVRPMVQQARRIERLATDGMRKLKGQEMLSDPMLDGALRAVLRKELGYVDDIAAEVERITDQLCGTLLDDPGLAARCVSFARGALEKKLTETSGFIDKRNNLLTTLVDAIMALHEVRMKDAYLEKLFEVMKRAPERPVLKASDVKDMSFLDAVWSLLGTAPFVGTGMSVATNLVGNVAGPPSLWIAVVQLRVWHRVHSAIVKNKLNTEEAKTLLKTTVTDVEKALLPTGELKPKFRAAMESGRQENLAPLKRDFLDEFTREHQAVPRQKVAIVLLQMVALLMAIDGLKDDLKSGKEQTVIVADVMGLAGAGTMTLVGIADASLSMALARAGASGTVSIPWSKLTVSVKQLESASVVVGKAGMYGGLLTSFLGVLTSVMQVEAAQRTGQTIDLGIGLIGLAGNCAMLCASAMYLAGVPMPPVQAAGLALASIAGALAMIKMAADLSEPGPNRVANALMDRMERSVYFHVLASNDNFEAEFRSLREKLTYRVSDSSTWLPLLNNDIFVRDALEKVGLRDAIEHCVDKTSAPIIPSGALNSP